MRIKTAFLLTFAAMLLVSHAVRAEETEGEEEAKKVTTTEVTVPGAATVSVEVTVKPEPPPPPAPVEEKAAPSPVSNVMAIACPTHGGKVTPAQAQALWSLIESAVPEGQYRIATRAALTQLCAEIGVPSESIGRYDFSKATPEVKEALAKHREVGLLLVTDISSMDAVSRDVTAVKSNVWETGKAEVDRIARLAQEEASKVRPPDYVVRREETVKRDLGSTYVCSVRLVETATGLVVPGRKGNFTATSLQELTDKLEYHLARILSDNKGPATSALLLPNVRVANGPIYLGEYANTILENALISNGIRLQNLLSVKNILSRNNLDGVSDLEPAMFVKVGKLLGVKTLMQLSINRFDVVGRPFTVTETGASGIRFSGAVGGYLRVVSAQTGELIATIPFEQRFNPMRASGKFLGWELEDFGKYYLSYTIYEALLPQLMSRMEKL